MTSVYLALGSNLGDPANQLQTALQHLATTDGCQLEAVSGAYASAAVGPGDQPDYLNAAVKLTTTLAPHELLQATRAIETQCGRVRAERWGARTLDIDILLYGEQKIDTQSLQIPHPRMADRNFVLYPLAEIAGEQLGLPSMGVLGSLLAKCPRGELIKTPLSLRDGQDYK